MLKIYDAYHNAIGVLKGDKETKETFILKDSDATLDFKYPANGRYIEYVANENYIQTEHAEYVIKSVKIGEDYVTVSATQNIEELEGDIESYVCKRKALDLAMSEVLEGTGWTVAYCDIERRRSISKTYCSRWEVIKRAKTVYNAECVVDSINKTLSFYEQYGEDRGAYFVEDLNLRKLSGEMTSYDFHTQIKPIGKNGLTIGTVNDGVEVLENHTYSPKNKLLIWKDERYTVPEDLKEDAQYKLDEMAQPYCSYSVDVIDLASRYPDLYGVLSYWYGDVITTVSKKTGTRIKQRIIKLTVYMHEPDKNTCEIANTKLDFIDIQKEAEETTDTLTSVIGTDGSISAEALQEALLEATGTNLDGGTATTAETVDIDGGNAEDDDLLSIEGGNAYN